MHLVIPHKFSQAQAKARVDEALVQAKPHLEGKAQITKEEWVGDTLNFAVEVENKEITGTLAVEAEQFVLDAKLPLLWRMFEGQITKAIEAQVKANM